MKFWMDYVWMFKSWIFWVIKKNYYLYQKINKFKNSWVSTMWVPHGGTEQAHISYLSKGLGTSIILFVLMGTRRHPSCTLSWKYFPILYEYNLIFSHEYFKKKAKPRFISSLYLFHLNLSPSLCIYFQNPSIELNSQSCRKSSINSLNSNYKTKIPILFYFLKYTEKMSWLFKSNNPDTESSNLHRTATHSSPPPPFTAVDHGVKEDLSLIFRGVANFLAPPPSSSSPPSSSASSGESTSPSKTLTGIRNDLVEIGGSFKSSLSLLSPRKAVTGISKLASQLLQSERDHEEFDGGAVPGTTDDVVRFVKEISSMPECWTEFPFPLHNGN